jgi:pimeloyl-ACP methyl ester carboxylesterase
MALSLVWTLLGSVSLTVAFQHFLGLPLAGFALGFTCWVVGRQRGIRSTWIVATGVGWIAGLGLAVGAEMVTGRLESALWAAPLGALTGIPVGVAQGLAARRRGKDISRRAFKVALAHAAFFLVLVVTTPLVGELSNGFITSESARAPESFALGHTMATFIAALALAGLSLPQFTPQTSPLSSWRRWPPILAVAFGAMWLLYDISSVHARRGTAWQWPSQFAGSPQWTASNGEQGKGWSERRYELRTADGERFHGYVFRPDGPHEPRPIVLYLHGSGLRSVRGFTRRQLVPLATSRNMIVATLDKIGVDPEAGSKASLTAEAHDDRASRVQSANHLLDVLATDLGPFRGIHVMGHSEGADVAAGLAATRGDLSSVVVLAGGGLGPADEARAGLKRLLATPSAFVDRVTARLVDRYVFAVAMEVLATPSTDRRLLGLTHRRWASYLVREPADDLLAFAGPVMSVHGDLDRNSPIETSRYLEERFAAAGRSADLTRRELPGLDHSFRDARGGEHLSEVFASALGWMLTADRR